MEPNTMRRIDFWVGVPLCFVVTLAHRLGQWLGGTRPPQDPPKRVLFIQLAEMGTMVVAAPALRKAREFFPDATLHFLCFDQARPSLEMLGILDPNDILTIDSRSLSSVLRGTLAFMRAARQRRIDTVINLESFVRFSSLLSYVAGAPTRVGFHRFTQEGLYTGDFLTHRVLYNPHVHAATTFLDLVHALVEPPGQIPSVKRTYADDSYAVPTITTDAAAERAIRGKLAGHAPEAATARRIVVLNPNASNRFPMRRLPLDSYAELASRLLADPDLCIVITGVASEKPDARYIVERVRSPRVIDMTGETTMTELLHLFDIAQVLVTNDSGPAHFACLTRVHVIVCFGPEHPDRYRPLTPRSDVVHTRLSCSPCVSPFNQRLTSCNDNQCLKRVRVDDVYALVRRRLDGTPAGA